MAELQQSDVVYQCVRGTDIKARYRVVAQNVPKYAEQTFYGTVLSRADLNHFQSHLELMWDGFDDPEVVTVHWIEPGAYDPEKAIMGLAPLYRAKAEPKARPLACAVSPDRPICHFKSICVGQQRTHSRQRRAAAAHLARRRRCASRRRSVHAASPPSPLSHAPLRRPCPVSLQLGEIIDLPEYPDCEWHTSAHIIVNLRMMGGVPSYTVWACA